jgi:hypothetical protein
MMKKLQHMNSLRPYMRPLLSDILGLVALTICTIILVVYITYNYGHQSRGIMYDCRLAEISPDFPPEVRNECRKLRSIKQ